MPGNSLGKIFCVTTFGESHGEVIGAVVDGCPAGIALSEGDIQVELDRRRPGQSAVTTSRQEADRVRIVSGVFEGQTLGSPILLLINNSDTRSSDYDHLKGVFRPSHADFTYQVKYGVRDWRGGGRASARETVARVAAGAIAQKILKERYGIEIVAYVSSIGPIEAEIPNLLLSKNDVDQNIVRCPDSVAAQKMINLIEQLKREGDSVGGTIKCVIRGVPIGLGEPVFDKLHADLGKAILSINAVKGFEIGSGFAGARLKGSEHNDELFVSPSEQGLGAGTVNFHSVKTKTNHAGGIVGGISNGAPIEFRVAFKPVATISKEQTTLTTELQPTTVEAKGRHDPCVVPRAVPIVEAMAGLVILDQLFRAANSRAGD